ncbi:MAG: polysaccharide deacetylase family protein [Nitrospirota bacterium]
MLSRSIPVVMYHHILPMGGGVAVTPEIFKDHLVALQRNGWKTLSGKEFLHLLHSGNIPRKTVLLTFDDGFADNYVYAYPILKRYRMKALLFVATSFIENADIKRTEFVPLPHREAWELACSERRSEVMCTWNELREMEESGIFDIQSHGHSHNIPQYINENKLAEIKEDLSAGKKMIEEMLSKDVLHLAWPKGKYDDKAIEIAAGLGFRALYTTDRGHNTQENSMMLHRLPAKNKNGGWLVNKIKIYSSIPLSKLYLALRISS